MIATQVSLWSSYVVFKADDSLWGSVPKQGWIRTYLLLSAAIAYVCNLVSVFSFERKDRTAVILCVLAYYGLQILFVPAVRSSLEGHLNGNVVRLLLGLCCVPILILAGLSVQDGKGWLIALCILSAAHVVVNDFVLYGFMFDKKAKESHPSP